MQLLLTQAEFTNALLHTHDMIRATAGTVHIPNVVSHVASHVVYQVVCWPELALWCLPGDQPLSMHVTLMNLSASACIRLKGWAGSQKLGVQLSVCCVLDTEVGRYASNDMPCRQLQQTNQALHGVDLPGVVCRCVLGSG